MKAARLQVPVLLILLVLGLGACGSSGSDEAVKVEEAIESSATSTDPADCTKLETQRFVEQTTRTSGPKALEKCEEEAGNRAESISVSNVEINGSKATADAAVTGGGLDGQSIEIALVKEGGQWKLDEVVRFTSFNPERLAETVKAELKEHQGELSPKIASCLVEALAHASRAEAEELFLSGSTEGLQKVAEECP